MTGGKFFRNIFRKYLIIRQILQTCEISKKYLKPLWLGSQRTKIFDSNLLKIDRQLYKKIDITIRYITIKNIGDYRSIHSVNLLYLIIGEVDGYIEENNGNKYLCFSSTDKNKEVLEKYTKLWDGIKNLIEKISYKSGEYEKDFLEIKSDSDKAS